MTLTVIETNDALDLDWFHEPECMAYDPCSNHVTWLGVKACCSEDAYACDVHRAEFDEWISRVGRVECMTCGSKSVSVEWRHL